MSPMHTAVLPNEAAVAEQAAKVEADEDNVATAAAIVAAARMWSGGFLERRTTLLRKQDIVISTKAESVDSML